MASKLSYLKGVRTRYRNTLENELEYGQSILKDDTKQFDSEYITNEITISIEKLKLYSEKLEKQTEKYVDALGDDTEEDIDEILEHDTRLINSVMDCYLKLQQLKDKILKDTEKVDTKSHVTTEQIFRAQQEMQKALFEQIGHQQQFLERQEAKEAQKEKEVTSKVRLPKLDILSYDGDKCAGLNSGILLNVRFIVTRD